MPYRIAGHSDIGPKDKNGVPIVSSMEDYMAFSDLDHRSENVLCVIADGLSSREGHLKPAEMAVTDIVTNINWIYEEHPDHFRADPLLFLKDSMLKVNNYLNLLRIANEQVYTGYSASVTCCYMDEQRRIYVAHAGNTRLYIVRNGILNQVTCDHTKAADMVANGVMDPDDYYLSRERLQITSGIGLDTIPRIQTIKGKLKMNDIILMTTDGIHYAIRPEPMAELLLSAGNPMESSKTLINAAKEEVKYADNMAVMIIDFFPGTDVPRISIET